MQGWNKVSTTADNNAGMATPDTAAQHPAPAENTSPGVNDNPNDKQQMVEKLFRHTNKFLEENKHDPLLVVESLAAILVRYTALFGPVEQIADRLRVVEHLVAQESLAIQKLAQQAPSQPPAG